MADCVNNADTLWSLATIFCDSARKNESASWAGAKVVSSIAGKYKPIVCPGFERDQVESDKPHGQYRRSATDCFNPRVGASRRDAF